MKNSRQHGSSHENVLYGTRCIRTMCSGQEIENGSKLISLYRWDIIIRCCLQDDHGPAKPLHQWFEKLLRETLCNINNCLQKNELQTLLQRISWITTMTWCLKYNTLGLGLISNLWKWHVGGNWSYAALCSSGVPDQKKNNTTKHQSQGQKNEELWQFFAV